MDTLDEAVALARQANGLLAEQLRLIQQAEAKAHRAMQVAGIGWVLAVIALLVAISG